MFTWLKVTILAYEAHIRTCSIFQDRNLNANVNILGSHSNVIANVLVVRLKMHLNHFNLEHASPNI